VGFTAEWRECGCDYREGVKWEGLGGGEWDTFFFYCDGLEMMNIGFWKRCSQERNEQKRNGNDEKC
jgi:hypothetical protein